MSDFKAKIQATLDLSKIPGELKKIEKEKITLSNFTLDTQNLPNQIQASLDKHNFTINLTGIKANNISSEMQNEGQKSGDAFSKALIGRINRQIETGGIEAAIAKVQQKFASLTDTLNNKQASSVSEDLHLRLKNVETDIERLISLQDIFYDGGLEGKELISTYQEYSKTLQTVRNDLTVVSATTQQFASTMQVATLQNNMEVWLQNNSKAAKAYGNEINDLIQRLRELSSSGDVPKSDFDAIANGFKTIQQNAKSAGLEGKTFGDSFKNAFNILTKYVSAYQIIYRTIAAIKEMIHTAIELDSAFAQLRIITNATDSEMEQFADTAAKLAKNLGKSITDITKSIETFSRLGYSLSDSSTLAEYATILSNVADVETSASTTGLTAIIKGYQMKVDEASHISDVLVEVGQKYAVSASEMMEAYQKAGAALSATNTSFEKSAGLIAAANAATQNASTTGTALKTISARIRGSKTDLEELGEDVDDLANGFSKYAGELEALTGFNIMVEGTTDQYKDLYDIMGGIAEVWDSLTDTQQARTAEILGGVRQYQVIASILNNWGDAVGAYESAMDSAGAATRANDIYMETIAAHIQQFKATLQELSADAVNGDFIKGIVDSGTALLSLIDKLIDSFGLLGTLSAGAGIFALFKNFD